MVAAQLTDVSGPRSQAHLAAMPKPIRVLCVDDDPAIRRIVRLILALDEGLEVRTAVSGGEALALIEAWQPDAVLLDVMMPGMDGPATLGRIRQGAHGRRVRVIFMTGRAGRGVQPDFSLGDAIGIIGKPFDPLALSARVKGFLR